MRPNKNEAGPLERDAASQKSITKTSLQDRIVRRQVCGQKRPATVEAPLLRQLVSDADWEAARTVPGARAADLLGEAQQFLQNREMEDTRRALDLMDEYLSETDRQFLVGVVSTWRKLYSGNLRQPGTFLAAIVDTLGLEDLAEGVAGQAEEERVLAAARTRLTAAGVAFREDSVGGAADR